MGMEGLAAVSLPSAAGAKEPGGESGPREAARNRRAKEHPTIPR